MEKNNIDIFDELVAEVFAKLYAAFPIPCRLCLEEITTIDQENKDFWIPTIKWLSESGYINCGSPKFSGDIPGVVLTHKGLELMKIPSSLKNDDSIGDSLLKAVKSGGSEAAKSLIKIGMTEGFKLFSS